MLRRGCKRKNDELDDDYRENLSLFQSTARKRESMRLKINKCCDNEGVEKGLRNKINVETALCLGTAKFIKSASGSSNVRQCLEAAKSLKLSRHRVDMLKYELNKLRRGRGSPKGSAGKAQPSYAGVSLSDIRIPLTWKQQNKSDKKFALFVIARIGSQIYDTSLLYPVDPASLTDLTFDDVILFAKVSSYFEMTLEVYSHLITNDSHGSSNIISAPTPQKIARSISKAVGKTILRNFNSRESLKEQENVNFETVKLESLDLIGPKFELIASANLNLEDCSTEVENYELYIDDPNSDSTPPLFGSICCRLSVQPYCCEEEVITGPLVISKHGKTKNVWGSLLDWKLSLWNDKSQKDSARHPLVEIPIIRETSLEEDRKESSLKITNNKFRWEFKFDDEERMKNWFMHLSQHAADHRRWKQAATKKMEVLDPDDLNGHVTKTFNRTRSKLVLLYNNIGN